MANLKILIPRVQFRAKVLYVSHTDGFASCVRVEQLTELHDDAEGYDGYEMDLKIAQNTAEVLPALESGEVYTFIVDLWARSVYKSGAITYYLAKAFKN